MGTPDYNQVNVEWTPPGGMPEILPQVAGPAQCINGSHGWYYNDPNDPTQILLCPYSCDQVEAASEGGSIRIVLGCQTVVR